MTADQNTPTEPAPTPAELAAVKAVLQAAFDRNSARLTPLDSELQAAVVAEADAKVRQKAARNAMTPVQAEIAAIQADAASYGITLTEGGSAS